MLRTRNASAETIFDEFSRFVRDGSLGALEKLFPGDGLLVNIESIFLAAISLFAMINRAAIQEEIEGIGVMDHPTPRWILDLTTTLLFSVLRHWGEVYDDLDVFCDKVQTIGDGDRYSKGDIGRRDHLRIHAFGKETQFTFNLAPRAESG